MNRGGRKPTKYGAIPTICPQGHKHASRKEAGRCSELHLMLRAGDIEALEVHPQFLFEINGNLLKHENGRKVGYTADFIYSDRHSGCRIVEDAKAVSKAAQGRDWPLRKAVFRACYPNLVLREV